MIRFTACVILWTSLCWHGTAAARANLDKPFRYELYFADHLRWQDGDGPVRDRRGPIASAIDRSMQNAEDEILMAVYGVRAQSWLIDRVEELVARDVAISAVVDQKSGEHGEWEPENFTYIDTPRFAAAIGYDFVLPDLNRNGKPRSGSIMHHKYLVIDQSTLWMGSANFSSTGVGDEYNANVVLRVDNSAIASVYAAEFAQMYEGKKFSRQKDPLDMEQSFVFTDGTEVDVLFAPQDEPIANGVLPAIEQASERINITMFYLTDDRIVDALVTASEDGVEVNIIMDALAARHRSSAHEELRAAGVNVRIENWGGKMHMKAASVDGELTIIGSMNWSARGEEANDENIMLINNRTLTGQFDDQFAVMWDALAPDLDPMPESRHSINSCFDEIDNDYDFVVDANEAACRKSKPSVIQ